MIQARIFTLFVFTDASPEGIIHYTRHLVPACSLEEAKRTARKELKEHFPGFAVIDTPDVLGTAVCAISVNTLRDHPLTVEEFKRWKLAHLHSMMIDGQWLAASHHRLW